MTLDELIRDVMIYMDDRGLLEELKKKYPPALTDKAPPKNNSPP